MRLIDADALIESVGVSDAVKWGNKDRYQQDRSYSTLMRYEIKDYIDSQETVDAVPVKHGRWIHLDPEESTISGKCSCCGWEAHYYEDDVADMPYCPSCGAKMDLEEQDAKEKT